MTPVHQLRGQLDAWLRALAYWLGARPVPGSVWFDPVRAARLGVTERQQVGVQLHIARRLLVEADHDQVMAWALADAARQLRDHCHWQALTLYGDLRTEVRDDAYTFVRNVVLLYVEADARPEPWQWWRSRRRRLARWWAGRPLQRGWARYWQLVRVQPEPYRGEV